MSDSLEASMMKRIGELKAENARLKAEVERLTAKQTDIDRVQAQSDFYRSKLMNETAYTADIQLLDQVKHLEAQVERLTKGGDEMVTFFPETGRIANAWHAAKHAAKGVQS